jgi:hypothetical protein
MKKLKFLGAIYLNFPIHTKIIFFVLLAIFKSGLNFEKENAQVAYLPAALNLPQATNYHSASIGNAILARLINITTPEQWIFLHFILTILALYLGGYVIYRKTQNSEVGLILLLTSTAAFNLFLTIGKYDPLTFLGAAIIGVGTKPKYLYFGAFIMVLGNPEQALVSMILIILMKHVGKISYSKKLLYRAFCMELFFFALIEIWMLSSGVLSNRVTLLPYFLSTSFANFSANPFSNIWFWMGPGWFFVCWFLVKNPKNKIVVISLILFPSILTLITADGARVFSLLTLPVILLVIPNLIDSNKFFEMNKEFLIPTYIIFWFFIPLANSWGLFGLNAELFIQNNISSFDSVYETVRRWMS